MERRKKRENEKKKKNNNKLVSYGIIPIVEGVRMQIDFGDGIIPIVEGVRMQIDFGDGIIPIVEVGGMRTIFVRFLFGLRNTINFGIQSISGSISESISDESS